MSAHPEQLPISFDPPAPVDRIQARFEAYHRAHPEVYEGLVKLARQAKAEGRGRYGIEALYVIFRWHRDDVPLDEDEPFKMNDHFSSRFARKIMAENPDLAGFFRVRPLRVERKGKRRRTA